MRLELLIDGMVAVHAKHAVFHALAAVDGITRAEVELGRAELEFARDARDESAAYAAIEAALREAIAAVGFNVRAIRRLPKTLPII